MNKVQLYVLKIPENKTFSEYEDLLPLVSKKRQNTIAQKLLDKDKIATLLSEILIKKALLAYCSLDIDADTIVNNTYGKPYLVNNADFHFNISHSADWVVCCVSSQPVGVDIEKIVTPEYALLGKYFSVVEINQFDELQLEERKDFFFDLWTLKESYIKAIGKGLNLSLNAFSIIKTNNTVYLSSSDDENYYFKQYDIDPRYKLSVCSKLNSFSSSIKYVYL